MEWQRLEGRGLYNLRRKRTARMLLAILVLLALPVSLLVLWRFVRLDKGLKAALTVLIALVWFVAVFFSP